MFVRLLKLINWRRSVFFYAVFIIMIFHNQKYSNNYELSNINADEKKVRPTLNFFGPCTLAFFVLDTPDIYTVFDLV